MTDTNAPSSPPDTPESSADNANDGKSGNMKAWAAGIGIGSAALVAALMYATKRPKRRGR